MADVPVFSAGVSKRSLLASGAALAAAALVSGVVSRPVASAVPAKQPPHPFPATIEGQLQNVIRGWTADGMPSDAAPTSPPLDSKGMVSCARVAEGLILRIFTRGETVARSSLSDKDRTSLIRKTIAYEQGRPHATPCTWFAAAHYLTRHPQGLSSPLSFADCSVLYERDLEIAERDRERRVINTLDAMRGRLDPPPRPVVWTANDGTFHLEKLIHPYHVWAEGHLSHGPLAKLSRQHDLATNPLEIPALPYWTAVREGTCLIYALRRRHRVFSDATVIHKHQQTIVRVRGPEAYPALAAAAAHLAAVFGPQHFMAGAGFHSHFIERQELVSTVLPWGPES